MNLSCHSLCTNFFQVVCELKSGVSVYPKNLLSTTSLKASEGCSLWNISHEPMGFCLHIFCIKPGKPGSLRFVVKNYHLEICLKRGTEKKHPPLTTNGEWKTKSGLLLNTRENPVQHSLLGNL